MRNTQIQGPLLLAHYCPCDSVQINVKPGTPDSGRLVTQINAIELFGKAFEMGRNYRVGPSLSTLSIEGRFTLWTMKSSHVRGLFCVGRLHGTTSMIRVTKILVFMVHGPFTRCKPNVDHAPKSGVIN
jgi:hypothetical protein